MPVKNIVIGQKVTPGKVEFAKKLRLSMTPEEKILWSCLRTNKLNGLHFRRQQVVFGYIADFYCHAHALIVEVDGGIHKQQVEYDKERDARLVERGFCILRISNDDINNDLQGVLKRILDACKTD